MNRRRPRSKGIVKREEAKRKKQTKKSISVEKTTIFRPKNGQKRWFAVTG
jgi:hypothetical protein